MRANAEAARAGAYTKGRTCAVPTGNATLAQRALIRWFTAMRESMGKTSGTCGTISQSGDNFSVTVEWADSHATDDGVEGANSVRNQVHTKVRLKVPQRLTKLFRSRCSTPVAAPRTTP